MFSPARQRQTESPPNLVRHLNLHAQLFRERPYHRWVLLELAANKNDVCLVLVEYLLCKLPVLDPADAANDERRPNGCFDGFSKVCLVRGRRCVVPGFDMLQGVIPSGGDVEEVDAVLDEDGCEANSVFEFPGRLVREGFLEPIRCGDASIRDMEY